MTNAILLSYVAAVAVAFAMWTTVAMLRRDGRRARPEGDGAGSRPRSRRTDVVDDRPHRTRLAPHRQATRREGRTRPTWFDGPPSDPGGETSDRRPTQTTARRPREVRRPLIPIVTPSGHAPTSPRGASTDADSTSSTPHPAPKPAPEPSPPRSATRDAFDAFLDANDDRF